MLLIQAASEKDIHYLDISLLQTVIDFKWESYTKAFFLIQFIKTIVFIASFILDLLIMSPDGFIEGTHQYFVGSVVTRAICTICLIDFTYYEFK